MRLCNELYVCTKRTQTESDWSAYKHVRNEVNNLMKDAYHSYCKHSFEDSHSSNRKRFVSLIKHQQKDFSFITPLKVNEHCVTSPLGKAENFFSTEKNILQFPTWNLCSFPLIGDLTFSTLRIENVLNNLSTDKSPGPDCIPNFVLKLYSSNIAPIIQVIFTQSHTLPSD